MAEILVSHRSKVLGKDSSLRLILPDEPVKNRPLDILYLLHGYSDDSSAWSKYSSIARYMRERYAAAVMPDAYVSFYTDMAGGLPYYSYISAELPRLLGAYLPLSGGRRFVFGLSMGGYGAFKLALSAPGYYDGAASFSGALDIARLRAERFCDFKPIFGDSEDIDPHDLFVLLKSAAAAKKRPRLYQWCGTEDFLYKDNLRFKNAASLYDFDYLYEESPGGHEWQYWDRELERALDYFKVGE